MNLENFPWYNDLNPTQQQIVNRIMAGEFDFTYGPGSPNPSIEDLNTSFGNIENIPQTNQ